MNMLKNKLFLLKPSKKSPVKKKIVLHHNNKNPSFVILVFICTCNHDQEFQLKSNTTVVQTVTTPFSFFFIRLLMIAPI